MRLGRWLLGGGLMFGLAACADIQCMSAPDRAACHAAYAEFQNCSAQNAPLIRHIGDRPVRECRREPYRECYRDRNGERHCRTRWGPENCSFTWEPIYDRTAFNQGVAACMGAAGQGGYLGRFSGW